MLIKQGKEDPKGYALVINKGTMIFLREYGQASVYTLVLMHLELNFDL